MLHASSMLMACVLLGVAARVVAQTADPPNTPAPAPVASPASAPSPAPGPAPAQLFRQAVQAHSNGQLVEAVRLWTLAAEAGHAPSAFNLGVVHEEGIDGVKNLAEAARWYLHAARAGDLDAHLAVARLYLNGQGVPASLVNARFWLNRLAAVDSDDAAVQALVQQAQAQLALMPADDVVEFKFEGGRYLFREMSPPRCVIVLQGRITRDTTRQFSRVVERARTAGCVDPWIALESPGGSLRDGIELGREMSREGYSTVVARSCASACALIFMGGRERVLIGPRARIGLHQSGTRTNDDPKSEKRCYSGHLDDASRLKRRYLREVLPEQGEAIFQRSMKTSCKSMDWIRNEEALQAGIATRMESTAGAPAGR